MKYLTGCMCAWLPCAAKCVFTCCVDRDGDGGELPPPSAIGTEHSGRQQGTMAVSDDTPFHSP